MNKKANAKFSIKSLFSLAVFLLGVALVIYYIAVKQRIEFDSDFTDTLIWADAMLTGNGIFDSTMNYAYTLPFGGSLLMAPFVMIFGMTYKAHVLGMIVFALIFTAAVYFFMKALKLSTDTSMMATGLILLLSLPTKTTRMVMWGHIIHYSLGLLFVLIGFTLYEKINVEQLNLKSNRKWLIILAVVTALFCTNGLTTILFFAIPFLGAIFIERFIVVKDELFCKKNINTLIALAAAGGAGVFGFVASKLMQRNVTTVYDAMYKDIQMWQHWVWDFEDRIRCMIVVCTDELPDIVPMESFTGIRILYMALFAFVILIIPFVAVISYKKFLNKTMRLFLISYYILVASSYFIFDFSIARSTPHRLVGIYMTAVIVTVMYMSWFLENKVLNRFGFVLGIMLMGAAVLCSYNVTRVNGENRYDRLQKVLKENDLRQGYAEYWSAQVTTVLSDSFAEVCPVDISEENGITKRFYNIRTQAFDTKADIDKYFVFLSAWEYEISKDRLSDNTAEVIPFDEDGYIVVLKENIF